MTQALAMTDDASLAEQYRARASELLRQAQSFGADESRRELLALAAEWQRMAEYAERRAQRKA